MEPLRSTCTQLVLQEIIWLQGYLTALLGNIMLLSYFLDRKENGGALVQAVGAGSNVIMLSQVCQALSLPHNALACFIHLEACSITGILRHMLMRSTVLILLSPFDRANDIACLADLSGKMHAPSSVLRNCSSDCCCNRHQLPEAEGCTGIKHWQ